MPLAYKWSLPGNSHNHEGDSVIKRVYQVHHGSETNTYTSYKKESLENAAGWKVNTSATSASATVEKLTYRNIFGVDTYDFLMSDKNDGIRQEIRALLNGWPVEPAAADISTYSFSLQLKNAFSSVLEFAIADVEIREQTGSYLWTLTSNAPTVATIAAGQTSLALNLTLEQAKNCLWVQRLILRPTSDANYTTSLAELNEEEVYFTIERRNPAAKGIASEITPGALAVIVGNEDMEIRYRYVQNYGGYAQAYISVIADNVNTGERVVIAKKVAKAVDDGLTATYTIPADTLAAGTWDVTICAAPAASANYYGDDDEFWTTGQTVRYTVKENPTAGGVTCDGKPVPTVSWESSAQAAWQVRFGDYDSGARAGDETSFTVPKIFSDGAYPVRVRTASQAGEWSEWADTYWATIRNVPPEGRVLLSAETVAGNVRLTWTEEQVYTEPLLTSESEPLMTSGGNVILASMVAALSDHYAVFRDGKLIAVTADEFYTDKTGGGEYQVIALTGMYYIPSNIVDLWPHIACDLISSDGGENWIPLKYTPDLKSEPEEVRTEITYYYYAGREKPIAVNTQQKSRSKSFSYRFKRRRDAQALRALNGCEVILKTSRGERIWGVVEDMTYTDAHVVTVSFSIRETDEDEDHVEYNV